jgi:hypothetical protein
LWADPDGALAKYLEQKDDLHAGRKPHENAEGLTVKHLANALLNRKQALADAGALSPFAWLKYKAARGPAVGGSPSGPAGPRALPSQAPQ